MITVIKRKVTKDDIDKNALFPSIGTAEEKIAKIKDWKEIAIETKTSVNPEYFKLMYGLANFVKTHCPEYSCFNHMDAYDTIKELQESIGDGKYYTGMDGKEKFRPNSLSYTQRRINENYDIIIEKLFNEVASYLQIDVQDLKDNYKELL